MSAPASLRRRLILAGGAGIAAAALAAAWLLGAAFERALLRGLDARLDAELDALVALAERTPDGRVALRREPVDQRYDRVFSGWYWAAQLGGATQSSRSAWDESSLEAILDRASTTRGHDEVDGPRAQRLRVASQRVQLPHNGGGASFAVAGDLADLRAEARAFRWFAALSVAGIALALLGVTLLQVGFGLRPLGSIAATLERLRRGEAARFDPATLPGEIAPLATQVNRLLDEHERRVERARHAAADLAHALKTPLTALALESATADDASARRVAEEVQRMRAAVDRHLGGALHADPRQRTPVRPVLESLATLMRRVHAGRAVDLRVEDGDGVFAGSREDLEELLGSLLDNACKWARARVTARVSSGADGLRVQIEDDGPGLPAERIGQALERGVRLDERSPGSGLGLSIAQEIVHSHGGELRIGRAVVGGLGVELRFPPQA